MRRTIKRTVTIVTTTCYTICWEASTPGPAPEPDFIVLPEPFSIIQDPPTKEFAKTIADNEQPSNPTANQEQPDSSFQPGEQP